MSALGKPVRAFSKGMTQKLGLAACLLSGKDLYVLDEPTSGLDPKARALLKGRCAKLREEGRTVFFTSHALADVEELCDSMAVIHRGQFAVRRHARRVARSATARGQLERAFLACIGQRPSRSPRDENISDDQLAQLSASSQAADAYRIPASPTC